MKLNSNKTTEGTLGSARALRHATCTREDDFGKAIIAVANSFTQFTPEQPH